MKKKMDKRSIIITFIIVLIAAFVTFAMISCKSNDKVESSADIEGTTILETNEKGETVVVATDEKGETVVYETNKSGKIKESKKSATSVKNVKKDSGSTAKTAATTAKTTTAAPTTKATQAQVCYISIDGYCSGKAVSIQGGDTAYSILKRSGASVSGSSSYVKGINGLYEFDKGPQSGWMYSVNGYTPNVGAGSYSVKAGDSIKWYYVTSY